jgi:hypothetical protein
MLILGSPIAVLLGGWHARCTVSRQGMTQGRRDRRNFDSSAKNFCTARILSPRSPLSQGRALS